MPGAGRSTSAAVRRVGGAVALIAILGYTAFGWSFGEGRAIVPLAIGASVAAGAIGWAVYSYLSSDGGG
jgi:uncharacterized membrane protein